MGVACDPCPLFSIFRRELIRRLLVALVLGAFLPVSGAAVACQVHCAGEAWRAPGTSHDPGAGSRHGGQDEHAAHATAPGGPVGPLHLSQYLSHAGPCHLSVTPVVGMSPRPLVVARPAPVWPPTPPALYASFVSPPPEHRPRA